MWGAIFTSVESNLHKCGEQFPPMWGVTFIACVALPCLIFCSVAMGVSVGGALILMFVDSCELWCF
jgi:hypothetical protein